MRNVNQQSRDHSFLARYGSIIAKGGIAAIPSALYRYQGELQLKPQIVWFISAILTHKWDAEMPSPSLRKMATDTGVSRQQLHNYKTELETDGWLAVINRDNTMGGKDSNYYDFTVLFAKLEELLVRDATKRQGVQIEAEEGEFNSATPHVNPSLHAHVNPIFPTHDNPSLHAHVNAGLPLIESVLKEAEREEIKYSNIRMHSRAKFNVDNSESQTPVPHPTASVNADGESPHTLSRTPLRPEDDATRIGQDTIRHFGMEGLGDILKRGKGRPSKQYDEERAMILAFIGDFAREFADGAQLKSSVTRAFNIYKESRLSPALFQDRMYQARTKTKERRAAIKGSRMAYFFACLETEAGLREVGGATSSGEQGVLNR